MNAQFRAIPSIEKSVNALLKEAPDLAAVPKSVLNGIAAAFWEDKRGLARSGKLHESLDLETQLPALLEFAIGSINPNLRAVLNATGVIIHTNLGRSILPEEACAAALLAGTGYTSLELNLKTGERGSRQALVQKLLCQLTGAEDAYVVNNNAAAVLLILDTLCAGGETIVSRGELVEIGGSFRIPDIMLKSGAILREVGTTNRTRIDDYRQALNEQTKALMRVHASNFRIVGFHESASLKELKTLATEANVPLIYDLGSGSLLDLSSYGLPREPTVTEILKQGADIVCFSGDKALGGPQAGIIAGKASLVESLKKNPLARAMRCDKLCLAALEATLRLYLDSQKAVESVPTLVMIAATPEELAKKASALARAIRKALAGANAMCDVKLLQGSSRVGGGSFPECELPTTLVCLHPQAMSLEELRRKLLKAPTPLVGKVEKDSFRLDPRTLARREFPLAAEVIAQALGGNRASKN